MMTSQAILVQGQCSEEKIRAMFQKCKPVKGKLGISEFEQLVGMMSETEKQTKAQIESQFGIEEGDEDEDEEIEVVIEAPQSMIKKSRVGVVNLTPDNQRTDFIEVKPTSSSSEEDDEEEDEEDDDENEDEDDDEELLSNVFKSLAGDKTYVAAKDLMNWDIVLELMGEVNTSILYNTDTDAVITVFVLY